MPVRVKAPTFVSWDVRDDLPPDQQDGISAVQAAWGNFMHVFTTTIPQLWDDISALL